MNRQISSLLILLCCCASGAAPAGTTVYSSGNGVAIVSGTGIAVGDVVVAKGPARTEERKPAAFNGLVIEAPVEMAYRVGAPAVLRITAAENILPLVTSEVKGGLLVIGLRKSVSMDRPIRVEATGPSPESVAMSGTAELKVAGVAGPRLRLEISGSGTVAAAGQVDMLAVDVSGSGTVEAADLKSREAAVDVSGSGTVAIHASASVKVDVSGSGEITVAGKPKHREVDRSGAGSVTFK